MEYLVIQMFCGGVIHLPFLEEQLFKNKNNRHQNGKLDILAF